MKLNKFLKLSELSQKKKVQDLNPYDKSVQLFFNEILCLFKEEFGNSESIDKVTCGLAPMLGPLNCINVYIGKDRKKILLPETFHGFPVLKIYESQTKQYKKLLNG